MRSKNIIFNLVLLIGIFRSSHDNALRWMPQDLDDDKSTLVQVMAWCRQATIHYLSQCWLSSLSLYGVARPQWVDLRTCMQYMCISFYVIMTRAHHCFYRRRLIIYKKTSSRWIRTSRISRYVAKPCGDKWYVILTHWCLGYLHAILKIQFRIVFYLLVFSDLMIMSPDECHGTLLLISQYFVQGNGLVPSANSQYLPCVACDAFTLRSLGFFMGHDDVMI